MGINKFSIEEREVLQDTVDSKNDLTRIIYRITTVDDSPSEDGLIAACKSIIDEEFLLYKALSFFFWPEGEPVGEIAAAASLTYAPGGIWENAFDSSEPMKLVVDFNRYAE